MIVTAETYHVPVLLEESISGLAIQPNGTYIDVTFGGGGHSREILRHLGPKGHLYSFDQDADAEKNIVSDDRFTFVRSNFRYIKQWMRYYGVERVDGLIADLGVSSHHFDDADRGFSFRYVNAQLDMRMNKRAGMTAADIVNNYTEQQLADMLYLYGELKLARKMADSIAKARATKRIETAKDLLQAIWGEKATAEDGESTACSATAGDGQPAKNGQWKKDAARLFQALRIEVNHEMEALKEMLNGAISVLSEGGRLVVITYHSLEDRIVKNVMKAGNAEGRVSQDFFGRTDAPLKALSNKVITPSDEELKRNPRSRSAKLRIAEKC